jgi:hypothetical protein
MSEYYVVVRIKTPDGEYELKLPMGTDYEKAKAVAAKSKAEFIVGLV